MGAGRNTNVAGRAGEPHPAPRSLDRGVLGVPRISGVPVVRGYGSEPSERVCDAFAYAAQAAPRKQVEVAAPQPVPPTAV